jgi:hypothetical protein
MLALCLAWLLLAGTPSPAGAGSLIGLARTATGYRLWSACPAISSLASFRGLLPRPRAGGVTDARFARITGTRDEIQVARECLV